MSVQRKHICKIYGEGEFEQIALLWLESLSPKLKASSMVKYRNILFNHLIPRFGRCEIESLTEKEVFDFINMLTLSGGKDGSGLSSKTVTDILSVLKNILGYAEQNGKHNMVNISNLSIRHSKKPMRIFSKAEQEKLNYYLSAKPTLTNLGILLCLYTGIRIGEVCALKWEDISFDEQYVSVHQTMQRIQSMGNGSKKTFILISEPKSECSIRNIPLPDELFKLITASRRPQNTYFLTGLPNRYVEPRTMQNHFKTVLVKCDIKKANFHALRHTFATHCIEVGFDVKSLSEILGHASVNITLNRYVHPSMELKRKNMNMLNYKRTDCP